MANVILMVVTNLFGLGLVSALAITAYKASGNRPSRVDLAEMNNSKKPASEVDLKPYLPIIIEQFPQSLDLKTNE